MIQTYPRLTEGGFVKSLIRSNVESGKKFVCQVPLETAIAEKFLPTAEVKKLETGSAMSTQTCKTLTYISCNTDTKVTDDLRTE